MAVGDLRQTRKGWAVEAPEFCHHMHELTPGHVQVGRLACTTHTGGHLTWRCECGDVTFSPPTDPLCTVVNGPAEVRNSYTGSSSDTV